VVPLWKREYAREPRPGLGSRLLVGAGVFLLVFVVGYSLAYGTEGLMALGLSRQVAGSITTALVIVACLYGLYWFATRMIDW
jgi:hypothetical protein